MIKIVGDINFSDGFFDTGFGVGSSIMNGADPFMHIKRDVNDFWIGNFECVSTNHSNNSGLLSKQFIISPEYLSHINHMDLYGVSNNHVMQHGNDAYFNMLKIINSFGSDHVGNRNKKTINIVHQNKKVAISSFSYRPDNFSSSPQYWHLPEYKAIQAEFDTKSKKSDYKIAYIHWGNEFMNYPYIDQEKFAHWLIDIGYDLVIGMHPHILQGYEIYNDKYIFYSLGNFVFNMPWYKTKYSTIIQVDLKDEKPIITYNYVQIGKDYFPRIIDVNCVPANCRFEYLNSLITHNNENEVYYNELRCNMKQYQKANRLEFIKNLPKMKFNIAKDIIKDLINRKFN